MMISIDSDELVMLYDHELLNVNVNDMIQQVMVEMRHTIVQVYKEETQKFNLYYI